MSDRLKKLGSAGVIAALLILAAALLIAGTLAPERSESDLEKLRSEQESRLEAILSQLEGAGKCRVLLTLDDSGMVCGVGVICAGGAQAEVRASLIGFICALYSLPSNHVFVGAASGF